MSPAPENPIFAPSGNQNSLPPDGTFSNPNALETPLYAFVSMYGLGLGGQSLPLSGLFLLFVVVVVVVVALLNHSLEHETVEYLSKALPSRHACVSYPSVSSSL